MNRRPLLAFLAASPVALAAMPFLARSEPATPSPSPLAYAPVGKMITIKRCVISAKTPDEHHFVAGPSATHDIVWFEESSMIPDETWHRIAGHRRFA